MPTSRSTIEAQEATLATAARRGEVWTSYDLEFLTKTTEIAAREVAEATGRTLYAVYTQRRLAAGKVAAEPRQRRVKAGQRWCADPWAE